MNPGLIILAVAVALSAFLFWRWRWHDFRPSYPKKPRQDEAIDAIWYGLFGVKKSWILGPRRPPAVEWIEGARLDYHGIGWVSGYDYNGDGKLNDAVAGLAHAALGHAWAGSVQVAWTAGETKFSDHPYLVHELYHCYGSWVHGNGDTTHQDHEAFYGAGGIVSRGVALLLSLGL